MTFLIKVVMMLSLLPCASISSAAVDDQAVKAHQYNEAAADKLGNKDFVGAEEELMKALVYSQEHPTIRKNLGAVYFEKGANLLGDENNILDAMRYLEKALEIDPSNVDILNNMGITFGLLGKYNDAIQLYDKILELMPANSNASNNKANSLYHLGHLEDAILWYDKTLEIEPKHNDAKHNKKIVLEELTP